MRILHCADLHIDSPLSGLSNYVGFPADEVRGATRRAVQNLVDYALDPGNEIDVVTVGGDVFDGTWPDADTGLWWNLRLGELAEAGKEVFVVHGNHDAESKITTRITAPAGVHVFGHERPATVESTKVNLVVHGQSYRMPAESTDLGSAFPDAVTGSFNMGLLHTSLDGRPGHAPYAPCTPGGLARKGYQLWGLGHIHLRDDQIEAGGSRFIFPGNTQGRKATESGPKGAVVVTVDGTTISDIEFVQFDVVRWTVAHIDIAELTDFDQISALVQEQARAAATGVDTVAVRVEVAGTGALHSDLAESPEKLETQLRADLGVMSEPRVGLEKVKITTRAPARRTAETVMAEEELRAFVERAAEDPELLRELASELSAAAHKVTPFKGDLEVRDRVGHIDSADAVKAQLEQVLSLLTARIGGN